MSNNSAAQAELNRIHNLIGAKPLLPGQNSKGIVFAIPNPRGFTTGHALMNKLPYQSRAIRNVVGSWVFTAAFFVGCVMYKQADTGYWFKGKKGGL